MFLKQANRPVRHREGTWLRSARSIQGRWPGRRLQTFASESRFENVSAARHPRFLKSYLLNADDNASSMHPRESWRKHPILLSVRSILANITTLWRENVDLLTEWSLGLNEPSLVDHTHRRESISVDQPNGVLCLVPYEILSATGKWQRNCTGSRRSW